MALNMDDLIGSMQHGFHAGDRGNDLNEIRESLKLSLGNQQHHISNSAAGPSNPVRRYAFAPPSSGAATASQQGGWDPRTSSSLDADVAMLSSSSSNQYQSQHLQQHPQQYWPQQSNTFFGASGGGPGSWGSQSSASSSNFGAPIGGWGFAPAPANTPQQTPVETSALARQLQAELERTSATSASTSPPVASGYLIHSTPSNAPLSPTLSSGPASPPTVNALNLQQHGADSPRSYVNGFSTAPKRENSTTPVGLNATSSALVERQHSLSPHSPDPATDQPALAIHQLRSA